MKKFLSKKPVMITFIVLAVLFLAIYIGLLVRPVSVGMSYSGKEGNKTYEYQIKSSKKYVERITADSGSIESEIEYWYAVIDGKWYNIGATAVLSEENYNSAVKTLKGNELLRNSNKLVNTFKIEQGDVSLTCNGAIAFAVVGGMVELGLIAFMILSIVNQKKGKKSTKKSTK